MITMDSRTGYDRYVNTLNSEITVLRDENRNLKDKINEMTLRVSEGRAFERSLDHENHHLKHDLTTAERFSRSMQMEKDQVLLDNEIELTKLQTLLKQFEMDNEQLNGEKETMATNLSELQQSTKMIELDLQESHDLINRLQDDKLRLSQRVEKLTANERVLVLEIERLKRHGKTNKTRESVNQIEQYMRGIEQDRDYWKNEADLHKSLQKRSFKPPTQSSVTGPIKPESRHRSPKRSQPKEKLRMKELEREKEELKQQLEFMRTEKSASPVRTRSPSPGARVRSPSKTKKSDEDVAQLCRERDDLRNLLNKLEKRVGEIQSSVRLLTQEKDRYYQLYEEARKEVHQLHQELMATQEDGGRANSEAKRLLNRIESERESLQCELSRVQSERDNLLERYKATVETANEDKFLLEQKIQDLSKTLQDNRLEKKDMTDRMESLRLRILNLESEVKNLEFGARQNLSELENEKETGSQVKQQLKKAEMHLEAAEKQIVHLSNQLSKSEERTYAQEQKMMALTDDLRIQRDDFTKLRSETNRLDGDKDQLKSTLNEASQRLRQLENDLGAAEDELHETRENLSVAEQQLGRVTEALSCREKENRHLRKKADNMSSQSDEFQRKINILSRDNDRLTEEIGDLKRANKNLQKDFGDAMEEREELRAQAQNYIREVKTAEDLLAQREQDQRELLAQFEALSENADVYKIRLETCQRDLGTIKQELADRENEIDQLNIVCEEKEKELCDKKMCIRDLESKISHLTCLVHQNKEQVKHIQHERDDLMSDLCALRDLCGRLERSKEEFEKELESKTLDIEQLQATIEDLENEAEGLKEDLHKEQENNRNVETLLQVSRNQEQGRIAEVQEKAAELSSMNDKLQMNDERIQQFERDSQRLKSRISDLEKESERLQRALSNEKFEKDRALSELRIQSLSPSYKPSSYLSNGNHRSSSPCRGCSP